MLPPELGCMPNELARARRARAKVTFVVNMLTNEDVPAGKVRRA